MSKISAEELGKRIQDLRAKKGLSQSALAEAAEVTRATISKWEAGITTPDALQLSGMAEILGVSIDYLCGNATGAGETICVLDTCAILDRPNALELLVKKKLYSKIVIPDVVIQELNYRKDHAKGSLKQKAWLSMTTIQTCKDSLTIGTTEYAKNEINDDKIIDVAKDYALANLNNKVDVLTNDVFFSLRQKSFGIKNMQIVSMKDISARLYRSDRYDEFDTSKFISAIKNGRLTDVQMAYSKMVDLNRIDPMTGMTPLILAVRNRNRELLEYLLSLEGIDVDKRDDYKYAFTPLLHACQLKDLSSMKILLEHGANVNASSRGRNRGNTPLMVCSWKMPFLEGIHLLMENPTLSYNQQDNNGFTALHKACIATCYETISLLIDHVDRNIEDFENKKAVEYLDKSSQDFERISALFNR